MPSTTRVQAVLEMTGTREATNSTGDTVMNEATAGAIIRRSD
jgi:hypothetical protein